MRTTGKMLAMIGLLSAALSQGKEVKLTKDVSPHGGGYFMGGITGFNHNFKTPNQRQKRKYARQNPQLRKKWGMK